MIPGIRGWKLHIRAAALLALAAIPGRPVLAQSYTISTVLGGLPGNGTVAKTTAIGPYGFENVTADSAGNLYFPVANAIFKLTASTGELSRIAGTGASGYSGDNGPALSAELDSPQGMAVDPAGNPW